MGDNILYSAAFLNNWGKHKDLIFRMVGPEMAEAPANGGRDTGTNQPSPSSPLSLSSNSLNLKQVFRSISPGSARVDGKAALRAIMDTIGSDLGLPTVSVNAAYANQFLDIFLTRNHAQ